MQKKEKKTFIHNGIRVGYHKLGSGPPLLILHGWGSQSSIMMPLAEKLSDIRTCFVPDLPGFGDSASPDVSWSVDDYVDFAEAFSTRNMEAPIDVLAHSFGARMVLKWCVRDNAQEKLRHVLITGGAGMKPRRTFHYYRKRIIATILKAPLFLLPENTRQRAMSWLRNTRLWRSLGSADYRELDGVMRETFVKTVSENLEPCLPKIGHEIFLLWGKDDEATPWYQAERMEQGLEKAALVGIDNAGHYAFLDQPAAFEKIARAYFQQK